MNDNLTQFIRERLQSDIQATIPKVAQFFGSTIIKPQPPTPEQEFQMFLQSTPEQIQQMAMQMGPEGFENKVNEMFTVGEQQFGPSIWGAKAYIDNAVQNLPPTSLANPAEQEYSDLVTGGYIDQALAEMNGGTAQPI